MSWYDCYKILVLNIKSNFLRDLYFLSESLYYIHKNQALCKLFITMLREEIILNNTDNLNIREFKRKYFEMPWHSHGEYELVYIISGCGKKFIGESMNNFFDHDLTFIGPNTPHFFLADDHYYGDNNSFCHWWVIQFSKDIFPAIMDKLEAFNSISKVLSQSQYGLHFSTAETRKHVLKTIKSMRKTTGLDRIITLYQLLNYISKDQSTEMLCTEKPEPHPAINNDIINTVYTYLLNNFKQNILLEDIAQLMHMRVTTLCTYYKRHTLKSIIESLNEIRISHACKLLVNSRLDINQIAYESGFRNISNFNRHFLKIKNITPKNYRSSFLEVK